MNSNILQIYSLHIEKIKIMNETKMVLFAGDKIEIAAALVRTAAIAIESKDIFMADGRAVAATLEVAGTELRRCRNVMEFYLQVKQQEKNSSF